MTWRQQHVRTCWMAELGRWVDYPLRMAVLRPVTWTWEDPFPGPVDVYDGLTMVWIGPAAPHPYAVHIDPPRQVNSLIPHEDMQFPEWKAFYASKMIQSDRGCAWPYEVGPEIEGSHTVIWKVWDYDAG